MSSSANSVVYLYRKITKFLNAIIPECNLRVVKFDWLHRLGGREQTCWYGEWKLQRRAVKTFTFWTVVVTANKLGNSRLSFTVGLDKTWIKTKRNVCRVSVLLNRVASIILFIDNSL